MADNMFSALSSIDQINKNHEMFKDLYTDDKSDIVNQETFLKLLVAEMSNQDPLEPTSNTEFVSQLAQFSSMQYAMDSSKYAESNYASGLVGKVATASRTEGTQLITKTGVVEKVRKGADNSYLVTIEGEEFPMSSVNSIQPADTTTNNFGSVNSLASSIAQAAMMVGMFATVQPDGSTNGVVAGLIGAIKVKDGKLYAVINSKDYALESLQEVTYAYVDDGSNGADKDGTAVDKADGTETENDGSTAADNQSDDDVASTAVGAEMEA